MKSGVMPACSQAKRRAGAAEAHGDLVCDEMHAVPVAGFPQELEIHRVVHAHVAGALHQGLQDHGSSLCAVPLQGLLHIANIFRVWASQLSPGSRV